MKNFENHHRKSIRLKDYDYSCFGYYFITICTHNRELLFGNIVNGKMILNNLGKIVEREWLKTSIIRKNVELDEFVVMPNHLHGIVIIKYQIVVKPHFVGAYCNTPLQHNVSQHPSQSDDKCQLRSPSNTLGSIIRGFKSSTARQINILLNLTDNSIWQRNYFEHIIRNDKSLNKIREYIYYNPVQWESDRNNPDNFY